MSGVRYEREQYVGSGEYPDDQDLRSDRSSSPTVGDDNKTLDKTKDLE